MIDHSVTPDAHPVFQERLDRVFARLPGLGYTSVGRSYDQQAYLRRCFETGRCNNGNPANLPGYSFHEAQEPDGYCLAVDLDQGPYDWNTVHVVCAEEGLWFPIWKQLGREPWHCEPDEVTSGTSCPGCVPPPPFATHYVVGPPPPPPDPLDLKGRTNMLFAAQTPTFLLQNRHSGRVMDVLGAQVGDGAPVETYPPHGGDNQRLYLDWYDLSTATCRLVFKHSGRVLDLTANRPGAGCVAYPFHGGANQLWRLQEVDVDKGDNSHYYMIHTLCEGGGVLDASPDKSMNFYLWKPHGGVNQQWRFQV